jgi:8-oxo-dGTP diphosphatase
LPAGRVHDAEPLFECAKRELAEETGLQALSMDYVGVVREPQKEGNFVHFAFVCKQYQGEPSVQEPDKCEAWNFVPLRELPAHLLPGHAAALELFINKNEDNLKDLT